MTNPSVVLNLAQLVLAGRPADPAVQNFVYATAVAAMGALKPTDRHARALLQRLATCDHLDSTLHQLLRSSADTWVSAAAWSRGDSATGDVLAMLDDNPSIAHLAAGLAYADKLGEGRVNELLSNPAGVVQEAALLAPLPTAVTLRLLAARSANDGGGNVEAAIRRHDVAPHVARDASFSWLHRLVAVASPSVDAGVVAALVAELRDANVRVTKGLRRRISAVVVARTDLPPRLVTELGDLYCGSLSAGDDVPNWVLASRSGFGPESALDVFVRTLARGDARGVRPDELEADLLAVWVGLGPGDRGRAAERTLAAAHAPDGVVTVVLNHLAGLGGPGGAEERVVALLPERFERRAWMNAYPRVLLAFYRPAGPRSLLTSAACRQLVEELTPAEFDAFVDAFVDDVAADETWPLGVWQQLDQVAPLTADRLARLPLAHLAHAARLPAHQEEYGRRLLEALPALRQEILEDATDLAQVLTAVSLSSVPARDAVAVAAATH